MTEKKIKRWNLRNIPGDVEREKEILRLAEETGYSPVMCRLLYSRGYTSADAVDVFLRAGETLLHDPFLMCDMERAVARISEAVEKKERIAVYGDYDVDGVTSVTLLTLYLRELGAETEYYIPSRTGEGYGLTASAMDQLAEHGVKLMITVDTGITAVAEVEYAKGKGIETVVTDHHTCCSELPRAVAVINPHRPDDGYPFKDLAGVGVVFKLIDAMERCRSRKNQVSEMQGTARICKRYLDLVAVGTIADVMPVVDENRLIVKEGLRLLERNCRPGFAALMEVAAGDANKKRKINSSYIGFTIAPRINAAGRVSTATIAVRLLLSEDMQEASEIAKELCDLNTVRQVEENRIAEEAYRQVEKEFDPKRDRVLVLSDDHWMQGIIGIVSSRVTERYGLPSILISFDGSTRGYPCLDDVGKGSGRSIHGMNLVEALGSCSDLLERYGGHELAAGLSVRRCNLDELRRRLNEYAENCLKPEDMILSIEADCEVEAADLTMDLASEIDRMEPFGIANPVPLFVLRDAHVLRVTPMGNGKHVRLNLEKDGCQLTAVWFNISPSGIGFDIGSDVDLVFQLNVNEYLGNSTLQLVLQDARLSDAAGERERSERERYEAIKAGATFGKEEDVLPTRDDIALVFTVLRREYRAGRTVFPIRRILPLVDGIHYIKLKFIIHVMQELSVCGITETEEDTYVFDFCFRAEKTNIEKSSVLRKLRTQMR